MLANGSRWNMQGSSTQRDTQGDSLPKCGFPNAGSPDGWDEKFSNQTAMMMNEAYIKRMSFP